MTIKLGVVMDPIAGISAYKDSTLAMLLAAQQRDWSLYYMEPSNLYMQEGQVYAVTRSLCVADSTTDWFTLAEPMEQSLANLDVVLMRKDPPFDIDYIATTYLLELAQANKVLVVNNPQALRDINEKCFISYFPQCTPSTLITCDMRRMQTFIEQQGEVVVKPLDSMGGESVFYIHSEDSNLRVILETITEHGQRLAMIQCYVPAVKEQGDKRILLIDGEPVEYGLARMPQGNDFRGNLAAGGKGMTATLTKRERWICQQVGPVLQQRGVIFAGLDVIDGYLTEINVTSPTCIREIQVDTQIDIAGQLLDCIVQKIKNV